MIHKGFFVKLGIGTGGRTFVAQTVFDNKREDQKINNMKSRIIAIFNQKGGAGKTTISIHLAVGLNRRGRRTALVDTDEQSSAMTWAAQNDRQDGLGPAVLGMAAMGARLHQELRKHVDHYDFIVVDCPPAIASPIPRSAMLVADLAIIPMKASPVDIWAARAAKDLALDAQTINTDMQIRVLPNEVQRSTRMAREAIEVLSEDRSVPVMRSRLALRSVYRECAVSGSTVYDMPRARDAAAEVDALTEEVLEILGATT